MRSADHEDVAAAKANIVMTNMLRGAYTAATHFNTSCLIKCQHLAKATAPKAQAHIVNLQCPKAKACERQHTTVWKVELTWTWSCAASLAALRLPCPHQQEPQSVYAFCHGFDS